ncbi:MAG TPA: GTPase Era [Candidatus Borkfalkia faecavium]|uniref:GTPase Era n=1 Tax=Candidatus Borkfalkia faecavium TaxID=2838508 RepID=A0A9D1W037_9FIRM|nr:GTPase Era [Candidatus Borkfalkia faecavium]
MKAGTVAVIGKANAGKSTLVNCMVGEKVAIVSPKPQTTRDRILGVLNEPGLQIAFLDTPGIYRSKTVLSERMMKTAESSAKDVDLILYVHDGHKGVTDADISLMRHYLALGEPMLIAYTKTDIMPAENIPADAQKLFEAGISCTVVPVSARRGKNISKLKDAIAELLPEGEPLFPEDVLSDKSEKFMVGEIMREGILLRYDKEIPHGVAVLVNTFKKREDAEIYDIDLDIICEKSNHKAILIGKQGSALKETLSGARREMEKFLGCKVFLTAYVKVKDDWRDKANLLKEYGYGEADKF